MLELQVWGGLHHHDTCSYRKKEVGFVFFFFGCKWRTRHWNPCNIFEEFCSMSLDRCENTLNENRLKRYQSAVWKLSCLKDPTLYNKNAPLRIWSSCWQLLIRSFTITSLRLSVCLNLLKASLNLSLFQILKICYISASQHYVAIPISIYGLPMPNTEAMIYCRMCGNSCQDRCN